VATTQASEEQDHDFEHEDVIDVDDTVAEEIPVELAEKVTTFHTQLTECAVQAKRGGRWSLLKKRVRLSPPNDDQTIDEICLRICAIAAADAERGEAERYRARLTVLIGDKHAHRYAGIRTSFGDQGEMIMVDDRTSDRDVLEQMLENTREVHTFSIRSLEAVVRSTEHWEAMAGGLKRIADSVVSVVDSVGDLARKNVEGEVEVLRLNRDIRQDFYQHQAKMHRTEKLAGALSMFTAPLGPVVAQFVQEVLRNMKFAPGSAPPGSSGGSGSSSGGTPPHQDQDLHLSPFAREFKHWFRGLDGTQKQFRGVFNEDCWKLIESGMEAKTDDAFRGTFTALNAAMSLQYSDDPDAMQTAIMTAVGLAPALQLKAFFQRVEATIPSG
jgi:hypothetical protein